MDESAAKGSGDGATLDDLVFRFLEDCEDSGAPPSSVLEALCREHPDAAPRLRAAVETLSGTGLGLPRGAHEPEARVVGHYRLIERLGAGGMGVVHRAEPTAGGPEVALKLLHPREMNEPGARERFVREARAIELLDHPAIVRVLDHGEVAEGTVSTPFIAMTFHRGVTLDRFVASVRPGDVVSSDGAELGALLHTTIAPEVDPLERSSRLRGPWWQVVARFGAELASALAHAHERGVVHRDVKPSNVLATRDGRVLLLDFGLALTKDSGRLTRSGALLGSLPYMAPEQVGGGGTDAAVDVYALGLVLHELLTLAPAFDAPTRDALAVAIERGASLRPSREVDWIPPAIAGSLDAVIERATQRDPRHRYPTARAFADDLDALVAGRPVSTEPISAATRALRAARRHPWHVALAGVVALFTIAGLLVLAFYEGQIAANERAGITEELGAIETRLESLRSGFVGISIGPLGGDPRFAPSALNGMLEEREQMRRTRERLAELDAAGVDVGELALRADGLMADVLIGIANAHASLGDAAESIEAYRDHRAHIRQMLEDWSVPGSPSDAQLRSELGRSNGMLARALHLAGPIESALEEATRSVELIEEVHELGMDPELNASQLTAALQIHAEALVRSGERELARAALDRAEAVNIAQFGPDPTGLHERGQRGEIELRRVRYDLIEGGRPARIAALQRSIEWFDGSRQSVAENGTLSTIRLDAGRWLALELRRDRRFEEAAASVEDLMRLSDRLAAARGEGAGPDDPFVRALDDARLIAALIRMDIGDEAEREGAIAELWEAHERARISHLERPGDSETLIEYLRCAGNYANQAVFREDVEPWQVERAIEAAEAALDASEDAEGGIQNLYLSRCLCSYALGLALVRAGRSAEVYASVKDLERAATLAPRVEVDPDALRMAADLCNELYLAAREGPGRESLRARTFDLLEAAVDAGYADTKELRATEALDPLRGDPRFIALLESIEGSAEGAEGGAEGGH